MIGKFLEIEYIYRYNLGCLTICMCVWKERMVRNEYNRIYAKYIFTHILIYIPKYIFKFIPKYILKLMKGNVWRYIPTICVYIWIEWMTCTAMAACTLCIAQLILLSDQINLKMRWEHRSNWKIALGKASKKKRFCLGKSPKLWVGGGQES